MLRIKTEKIVERGEKKRMIIGVEGIIKKELISEKYFKEAPYIKAGKYTNGMEFVSFFPVEGERGVSLEKGNIFDEALWETKLLPNIKKAGEKLHQLRIQERQLREEWEGEETFVI